MPAKLLAFCECGLEIAFVQGNLRSYNKFIHALQDFKDSIIVTADDDVIYSPDWLKLLYDAYLKEPQFIHCHRAHRISFDSNGEIRPYQQWQSSILYTQTIPSYLNFFTGVGGVLYPPHCLHEDILKQDLFLKLCPSADDIWFFAMALLKGTKINVVKDNIPTLNDVDWDGNHDLALYRTNVFGGANDKQLANVMTHYPQLKEKIRFDSDEYWEIRYKSHTDEVMGGGA
ncbi:hypothetical protein [Helicobacter sp. MIT 05-5293]|uniref:hypothetical protein n=1 Tax=Helicobacter sp. MIT 05-5293 TaxID=1548149 RepID=UPI00321FB51A